MRIEPPISQQTFDNFEQWVRHAPSWLTRHPEFNNTEHGEAKGWRGDHFTALCFDAKGRRCRNGADFMCARDEGAFPVWWIWPDQICDLIAGSSNGRTSDFESVNAGSNPAPASTPPKERAI